MVVRKRKNDDSTAVADSSTILTPTKRQKSDPDVEKRLARFKLACPKIIMERVDRVMAQRFFLIERERPEGQLREEFKVLGSTILIYVVQGKRPDATKGNHCKHILFIFLKVLSVPTSSSLYYQKALLSTELEDAFVKAPRAPNSLSHARVQAAYAKAMGRPDESEKGEESKRRVPEVGDDCPICYESMHDVEFKILTFCDECGNALHTDCFQQWSRTARPLTCVWCRVKWAVNQNVASSSTGAGVTSEGYLNLSSVAGVSPVRDTSSYYHGPRRGQKGWSRYSHDHY